MKRLFAFGLAAGLLVWATGPALAQAAAEAPKPGPEHKRLGYFVGTWKGEGEMKPNPFMPAGKFTTTETCEWFEGGFSVVCRTEGKGPMGPTKGLGIMSYSNDEKAYIYFGIENSPMVMASVPLGVVAEKTWTFSDESKMAGKTVKSRFVIVETSPTSYTMKWEMQGEDGKWTTIVEGTSTKAR